MGPLALGQGIAEEVEGEEEQEWSEREERQVGHGTSPQVSSKSATLQKKLDEAKEQVHSKLSRNPHSS